MPEIKSLQPTSLWSYFSELNKIPRPSKKEKKAIEFVKNTGLKLGLETIVDETGNVLIRKPASAGMENRKTVVLQGHLDMVHQKNSGTDFDFEKQGIEMHIDGDWVKAKGTTLGADNGIGSASILAILSSEDIVHPPIEALFTVDEETGMTGAKGLKGGILKADLLLNLDTENDHELCIGCAGGVDVTAEENYAETPIEENSLAFKIEVSGLTGGHSGMDIHIGRGNANKILIRLLKHIVRDTVAQIISIDGGGLRNAIPREAISIIAVKKENEKTLQGIVSEMTKIFKSEFHTTDPELSISISKSEYNGKAMTAGFSRRFLNAVYACPNGIYRMSPDIKDLVQSSNNVARIEAAKGRYSVQCLTRSSVDSEKSDLAESIASVFELLGSRMTYTSAYPGWTPKPEASIVKLMEGIYKRMFEKRANVSACHAGLECGILGQNYPNMEMISFGPNILAAHSPDERVQISSVQKYWSYLLEILKEIPVK